MTFTIQIKSDFRILVKPVYLFVLQLGARRVHLVRTRGGNSKFRALRLDTGNFSWGSECKYLLLFSQII